MLFISFLINASAPTKSQTGSQASSENGSSGGGLIKEVFKYLWSNFN